MKKVLMLVMVLCLGLAGMANAFIMIGFEAEPGINGSTWARGSGGEWLPSRPHDGASGGYYIGTVDGAGDNNDHPPEPGDADDGMSGYRFSAPAGSYRIFLRYMRAGSDSFWVRIVDLSTGEAVDDSQGNRADEPTWARSNGLRGYDNTTWWFWDKVRSDDDPTGDCVFILPTDGEYEVQIARREDGMYLDGFIITDAIHIDERELPDYIPYLQPLGTDPANGATGVSPTACVVTWDAVDGATYNISIASTFGYWYDVPGDITGSGGTASFNVNTLVPDLGPNKQYWWKIVKDGEYLATMTFTTNYPGPVIVSQPGDEVQIGLDCTATLEVVATRGDDDAGADLSYQWADSAGDIAGETGATLTTGVEETYTCTVTNTNATSVTTSPTTVNVAARDEFVYTSQDIAAKAILFPGSSSYDAGTGELTVIGSGRDIWNEDDEFHFVCAPCTGDGEWIARITNLENPGGANTGDDGWTKGGIMIRSDLSAVARTANIVMTRQGIGIAFQRRQNRNEGSASNRQDPDEDVPYWLKLTRVGNTFKGYHAPDVGGAPGTWTQQGQAQGRDLNIPTNAYVGFAVTSHNVHRYARGIFDNISGFVTTWAVTPVAPAQDEEFLTTDEIILSWNPAALGPCGATYEVFMGPSADELASLGAPVSETQIDVSSLVTDPGIEYFWSVTTHYGGDSEAGGVQSFRTVNATPFAVSQPVSWTVGAIDDEVVLEYVAESFGGETVDYQWIKGIGDSNDVVIDGAIGNELAITIAVDTIGSYYCKSSNVHGDGENSATAMIAIKRGLIHHWPLDEISGAEPNFIVEDVAGDLDGIAVGEPNIVTGIIGKACDLDPVAYIAINNSIGRLNSFSLSVWLNYYEDIDSLDSILHHNDWSNSYLHFHTRTDGRLTNNVNGTGGDLFSIGSLGGGNTPGEWYHVVMTYDIGAGQRSYYINGEHDVTETRSFIPVELFPGSFGAWNDNGNIVRHWDGLMDDIRIYDYVLSAVEIAAMYLEVFPGGSICAEPPLFDFDGDCIHTLVDFAIWAETFGACGLVDCD